MNWNDMQRQHRQWVELQFPNQPPEIPAAGLVEEAGELLSCIVKLNQEARWGVEPRNISAVRGVELIDAIGDCAIYACSFCNAMHWSFADVNAQISMSELKRSSFLFAGLNLVSATTNAATPPYEQYKVQIALSTLRTIAEMLDVDYDIAVERTWEEVQKRNRCASPPPRIVTLCGSLRFTQLFREAKREEALAGRLVFSVADDTSDDFPEEQLARLRLRHFAQIAASHEILVLDGMVSQCRQCNSIYTNQRIAKCSCGSEAVEHRHYVGAHTQAEVEYARSQGRLVRYWSKEHDDS